MIPQEEKHEEVQDKRRKHSGPYDQHQSITDTVAGNSYLLRYHRDMVKRSTPRWEQEQEEAKEERQARLITKQIRGRMTPGIEAVIRKMRKDYSKYGKRKDSAGDHRRSDRGDLR